LPPHLNCVSTLPCKIYGTFLTRSAQWPGVCFAPPYTSVFAITAILCVLLYEHQQVLSMMLI